MRILTTVILALVLIGVILLIHLIEDDVAPSDGTSTPLFPGLVKSTVDRIEMSLFLGRNIVLERRGGNVWEVTSPFRDQARQEVVTQVLEALSGNQRVLIPLAPEEMDLPSKGLDPPEHQLTFRDVRGVHTLLVGSRDPFHNEVYVMFDGDEHLYRTGANLRNIMELNPQNLRDNRIFRIDPLLVNRVEYENPAGLVLEAEKMTGIWEIIGPIRTDSNSGNIQNLISRLCSLRAISRLYEGDLTDEVLYQHGFGEPGFTFTLEAGSITRQVKVEPKGSGPSGDYLAIRDGEGAIVGISQTDLAPILAASFSYYRSRELMKPVRETLQSLRIRMGEELRLDLHRLPESTYFKIKAPFEAMADNVSDGNTTPVYAFLTRIDGLRIKEFVDDEVERLGDYGLEDPEITLELFWKSSGRSRRARMIFSKEDDEGMVFAARVDKAGPISVFKLATKDLEPLRQDALLLRDRRIFPQDVAIIQAAVFRKGDKLFSIERGEKGFFLDDPDSRFQQFLHRMKDTLVVRYLADPSLLDSPLFAVVKGAVELKLQEEGETSEVVVQFGTSCPDGRHGRISDQPRGIFIVGEDFMHEFDQLFKDL